MTRTVLIAVGVLLLTAPAADAKVWFQGMGGRAVHRGATVSTTIMGCPGNESCRAVVEGVVVFVRRVRGAPELERVGRISASGTLRFRVPQVRTGRYRLVTREGGRLANASSAFSVRPGRRTHRARTGRAARRGW